MVRYGYIHMYKVGFVLVWRGKARRGMEIINEARPVGVWRGKARYSMVWYGFYCYNVHEVDKNESTRKSIKWAEVC